MIKKDQKMNEMLADQKQRLEVIFYSILGIFCFYTWKSEKRSWRSNEDVGQSICRHKVEAQTKISRDWRLDEDLQENERTNGGVNWTISK